MVGSKKDMNLILERIVFFKKSISHQWLTFDSLNQQMIYSSTISTFDWLSGVT